MLKREQRIHVSSITVMNIIGRITDSFLPLFCGWEIHHDPKSLSWRNGILFSEAGYKIRILDPYVEIFRRDL